MIPQTEVPPSPACCLTGLGGHTRTYTATPRSGNCFRPPVGCRRRAVCAVRPIHCLLGLLAVAGLRISEARNLQTEDVDLKEGVLTIRGAKFGKSRLVPIHPSTRKVLSDYASRRDRFLARRPDDLLRVRPWHAAGRRRNPAHVLLSVRARSDCVALLIAMARVCTIFVTDLPLRPWSSGIGPVKTSSAACPILSTYLGHVHVADTYWYLSACPELMGLAVKRFEDYWEKQS